MNSIIYQFIIYRDITTQQITPTANPSIMDNHWLWNRQYFL